MRLRRLGPAAFAAGLFVAGMTACTGPPPPINHNINLEINLHDPTGAGVSHLFYNGNVTVDSNGNVMASTATLGHSSYGYVNFFGTVVDGYPVKGGGDAGTNYGHLRGWTNYTEYWVQGVWDVRLGYSIGGVGAQVSKGWCTATWPLVVISGGGQVDSQVFANVGGVRTSCHNGYYLSYAS